jgi:hypothetical protein
VKIKDKSRQIKTNYSNSENNIQLIVLNTCMLFSLLLISAMINKDKGGQTVSGIAAAPVLFDCNQEVFHSKTAGASQADDGNVSLLNKTS